VTGILGRGECVFKAKRKDCAGTTDPICDSRRHPCLRLCRSLEERRRVTSALGVRDQRPGHHCSVLTTPSSVTCIAGEYHGSECFFADVDFPARNHTPL